MPRYQDKMRLKRYIADHDGCDSLTEYLILKGFPDYIIENGLEPFVSSWEESVKWILGVVPLIQEEYDYDLSQRTDLYIALQYASTEQLSLYSVRIQQADNIFIQNTIEKDKPWEAYLSEIGVPDNYKHWWVFRIPKMGFY